MLSLIFLTLITFDKNPILEVFTILEMTTRRKTLKDVEKDLKIYRGIYIPGTD